MAETVQFENGRGEELRGTLRVPEGADRPPLVVFVHGWGTDRNAGEARRVADELEGARVAALLFDLSGHGESGGDPSTVTLEDHQEDLKHALAWARARGEFGSIGVAAQGSGAAVAIAVAAEDRGIAALVLRSPTARSTPPRCCSRTRKTASWTAIGCWRTPFTASTASW
ncbi:MAG: alpha/beta hydrolase [Planctomycetota bacterium]|jgi:pimeloyl-ACP methyl ester carboxylesterase